jgi:hypothetical protein
VWKVGGFDGVAEQGGRIEYLDLEDAMSGCREIELGENGPGARSVRCMQVVGGGLI